MIKLFGHIFTSMPNGVIDTEAIFSPWPAIQLDKVYEAVVLRSMYKKQGKEVNRRHLMIILLSPRNKPQTSTESWFLQNKMILGVPLRQGGRGQTWGQELLESVGQESCVAREAITPYGDHCASARLKPGLSMVVWTLLRCGTEQLLWGWDENKDARGWVVMEKIKCRVLLGFQVCQSVKVP